MDQVLNQLFDKFTEKYKRLIIDLNNGYSLKECYISELWEYMQLLDCMKFGNMNYDEFIKAVRPYE